MHPAKSVIAFTTLSGAGYGLLALICLGLGGHPLILAHGLAYALIVGGLLASTAHLGHPERAWRALSQWRTSWLSREGVLALLTFVPAGLFSGLEVSGEGAPVWLGWIAALSCVATVWATGMIYAVLKPVHQWHTPLTPVNYLLQGFASGATLACLFDARLADLAILGLLLALLGKGLYWRRALLAESPSTPESATGLGGIGKVRLLEGPHTQANYLLREMGFQLARRYALPLRAAALLCPLLAAGALSAGLVWPAIPLMAMGVVAERALFFAEARHAVALYYGARAV